MYLMRCILILVALFAASWAQGAESPQFERANKAVEIVNTLCLSGTQYALKLNAEGNLVFKNLRPGGQADVLIDTREAYGATGYFDEKIRQLADKEILDCIKPNIAPILATILSSSPGFVQEDAIEKDMRSGDPKERARAFRRAFESINVFHVDLDTNLITSEGEKHRAYYYSTSIKSPILDYSYETGKFSGGQETDPPVAKLLGQVNGDNISFSRKSCSGSLNNVRGTWRFVGLVTCDNFRYDAAFTLR